jgi:hypothetical protein
MAGTIYIENSSESEACLYLSGGIHKRKIVCSGENKHFSQYTEQIKPMLQLLGPTQIKQ